MAWGFIVSTQLRINRMAEWESDKTSIFIVHQPHFSAYSIQRINYSLIIASI